MTKEQAYVGLKVKYDIKRHVSGKKKRGKLTSHYGVITGLKDMQAIVRFSVDFERPCPYSKLEPAL